MSLAAQHRLPAMYAVNRYVISGSIMSYGLSIAALRHRGAYFPDKILKGAKPGDLPVEQPSKFELFINLKAARQIDLTIPPNVAGEGGQSDQNDGASGMKTVLLLIGFLLATIHFAETQQAKRVPRIGVLFAASEG